MSHDHVNISDESNDKRVAVAIWANGILTLVQIAGGIFSGSLALIADALHNFSDMASLVIAFAARKVARRPADARMTFGYGRIEIVAALINYTTLILVGGSTPFFRTLQRSPIMGKRSVYVEAKTIQRGVQARRC